MTWVLGYKIEFAEGEPEFQVLQTGIASVAECERLADLVPAVAYNGNRKADRASVLWGPERAPAMPESTRKGRQ